MKDALPQLLVTEIHEVTDMGKREKRIYLEAICGRYHDVRCADKGTILDKFAVINASRHPTIERKLARSGHGSVSQIVDLSTSVGVVSEGDDAPGT